jgi:mono/diheme cytochrome c family protein
MIQGGKKVIPFARPKPPGPPPPQKITGPITVTPKEPLLPPPVVTSGGELADRVRRGTVIFQQFCMVCHGEDGTGNIQRANLPPIPNFKDPAWHKTKQDAELLVSILNGKNTLMPPNVDRISRDEARDVLAYIRAFLPPRRDITVTESDFDRAFRQLLGQWNELEKELQKTEPGP